MSQHPNARLTPLGRAELVARVGSGTPVAEAARQMGVSRQTAGKWLSRARRGEPMSDRPCRPARLARSAPPADVERVLEARRSMLPAPLALAVCFVKHFFHKKSQAVSLVIIEIFHRSSRCPGWPPGAPFRSPGVSCARFPPPARRLALPS